MRLQADAEEPRRWSAPLCSNKTRRRLETSEYRWGPEVSSRSSSGDTSTRGKGDRFIFSAFLL